MGIGWERRVFHLIVETHETVEDLEGNHAKSLNHVNHDQIPLKEVNSFGEKRVSSS